MAACPLSPNTPCHAELSTGALTPCAARTGTGAPTAITIGANRTTAARTASPAVDLRDPVAG